VNYVAREWVREIVFQLHAGSIIYKLVTIYKWSDQGNN